MSRSTYTSAAYTTEFSAEFEVETQRLLRRRFMWFTAVVGGLSLIGILAGIFIGLNEPGAMGEDGDTDGAAIRLLVIGVPWTLMYIVAFAWALYDKPMGKRLINASILVVTLDGLIGIAAREMNVPGSMGFGGFMLSHFIATLFLPWTPVQAMRPAAVVIFAHVANQLLFQRQFWEFGSAGVPLLFSPLVALPGTVVCSLRHSRRTQQFKTRFFQARYGDLRRELVDAKRIHESLFPEPANDSGRSMAYTYEPARAIGGDFLFLHRTGDPVTGLDSMSLVLIDVTGHGIPAALTVNRLHGELTRISAEKPGASPGEVMRLVNSYVHLTLASHSIYATGLAIRINTDAQTLDYASAGHPPAFVRGVDGTLESLDSTAIVLGAAAAADFEPGQQTVRFFAGDVVLAYTDGVTEARGAGGKMLEIDGLLASILAEGSVRPGDWPKRLRERVERFRAGGPEADLLIVELRRSLAERETSSAESEQPDPAAEASS